MIYSYAEYLTEVLGKININARQNKQNQQQEINEEIKGERKANV